MAYWQCTAATIRHDGKTLELSFKDNHSCSSMTMELPSEVWKEIMTYKSAYDEPDRRMFAAHERLTQYFLDSINVQRKKTNTSEGKRD